MSLGSASKSTRVAGILAIALAGCSGQGGAAAGESGTTGSGGSLGGSLAGSAGAGQTGSPTGTAGTGGKGSSAGTAGGGTTNGVTGGTTSQGGNSAAGAAGGSPVTGGTSGGDGQSGASGRGGAGMGGASAGGASAGGASGGAKATGGQAGASAGAGGRSISFGTLLNAQAVVSAAQELAKSVADPSSPQWRAKGDQRRTYPFADAGSEEPYRICVPSDWDGTSELPLVMFLHGAGSNESTYLDQNNKQLVNLAQEHGYLLVSPKGVNGAYGNFLRLTAPFGDETGAAELMAQVTADSERTNQLSEQDVINVLEVVLAEYPIDRGSMFLAGHSMGSGGTWYIGGKYATYWKGIAPLSGPFVQKTGYPWDAVRAISIFVTEGTQTPSLEGSQLLRDWLSENGFMSEYKEVNSDHGGMIPLVMPDIFDFFDRNR